MAMHRQPSLRSAAHYERDMSGIASISRFRRFNLSGPQESPDVPPRVTGYDPLLAGF
jgi:hypothetical protein